MPNPIGKILGRRIRRIRQEKGLTLKQIEARVKVSATHISEIERGKTSPTVGALERISNALEVPVSHLIDLPSTPDLEVRRPDPRRALRMSGGEVQLEPLTDRHTPSDMSLFLATLESHAVLDEAPGHVGEEFCYVLDGYLEVGVNGQTHILKRGDTIHFKANQAHRLRNLSSQPVRTLWAVRPKLFI